jgi:SAM-dependent methyltransferase
MFKKIMNIARRIRYKKAISAESIEDRFSNIYKAGLWFSNKESKSGAGSTLGATQHIRSELPKLLNVLEATNIVDVGCGDFHWMKEVSLPCQYIGIDIVGSVIDQNNRMFGSPKTKFLHANMVEEELPSETDVVLCREVLFHLSFEDANKLIRNVIRSKARYFIVTSDSSVQENKDIRTGSYRGLNLLLAPFEFPPYTTQLDDSGVSRSRFLGVWVVEDLRKKLLAKHE